MATLNSRMLSFLISRISYHEEMDGTMCLELSLPVAPRARAPGDIHAAICMLMAKEKKQRESALKPQRITPA